MLVSIYLSVFGIFAIMAAVCCYSYNDDENSLHAGLLASFLLFLIIFISLVVSSTKPTAIDVYRGKTTLEVTYKNNIPIDSVVVFK